MADPHVLTALFDKYSEILGLARQCEKQADDYRNTLSQIETVIHLYQPEWRGRSAKARKPRKPSRWPARSGGMRTAMLVLRESATPLTTREIASQVFERLAMPMPTKAEMNPICCTLNAALKQKAERGLIVQVDGNPKRWMVAQSTLP